ncbi:MAG: glycosyltransferase family 2 protein [Sumerlaeia bacterium]
MNKTQVTIAICTYNRGEVLRLCLESLIQYLPKKESIPVILVDNASTDHTQNIAQEYLGQLNLQILSETEAGLSRARNKAIMHTSTEYIVYLDDDAKITENWYASIVEGINKYNPCFFGGPYKPFYLSNKPQWFDDLYGSAYIKRREGFLKDEEFVSGGNMGWKVNLLKELGGFPVDLGMIGNTVGLGEETYLQRKVRVVHPKSKGVFLPNMLMMHLVADYKLSLPYWIHRSWVHGRQDELILEKGKPLTVKWLAIEAYRLIFYSILLPFRDRQQFPHWKSYAMKYLCVRVKIWGRLYSKIFGVPKF